MVKSGKYWHDCISCIVSIFNYFTVFRNIINIVQYFTLFYKKYFEKYMIFINLFL